MRRKSTVSLVVCLPVLVSACATASLSPYEKFAAAGHRYTDSMNELLVVAQSTAIDKTSAELLDQNSFADRAGPDFNRQESGRLQRQRDIDLARIAVFADVRRHMLVVAKYFTQLNELVTTDEADKTSEAMAATAGNIDALSDKLVGQTVFDLDDEDKERISRVVRYVIDSRQRTALKRRIEADQEILQRALNTHRELLAVMADDLDHELRTLNDRYYQMSIEAPFLADRPLIDNPEKAAQWIEERRRLLTTRSAVSELKTASAAAASLEKALNKLLQDDADFLTQVEQLKAELDAIDNVIDAFK